MDGPGILIAFAGQPRQNEVITCQEQMAKNLILLSWLEPGKDIQIRFTGLKQGDKIDEELVEKLRELTPTFVPAPAHLTPD